MTDAREHYRRLAETRDALADAKTDRDAAIRDAAKAGLSLREIAEYVGVSHQRVAQIIEAGS